MLPIGFVREPAGAARRPQSASGFATLETVTICPVVQPSVAELTYLSEQASALRASLSAEGQQVDDLAALQSDEHAALVLRVAHARR